VKVLAESQDLKNTLSPTAKQPAECSIGREQASDEKATLSKIKRASHMGVVVPSCSVVG
jgi:hypothetical protein